MVSRHTDKLKLKGRTRLIVSDPKTGKIVRIIKGKNIVCTAGKQQIGDMLIDVADYDTGLTYQAIGTGTTVPTAADIKLTTEANRKVFTNKARIGIEIIFSTFFTAAQCTYNIKEAGVFGHSTAGGDADSGIIMSHWLVSYNNSAGLMDLTFEYILTIG